MQSGFDINKLRQEAQTRWLKPSEILFILQNHEKYPITHEAPKQPPSGSLFIFNRRVLRFFRKDGHLWRKKKDGRTIGEAHERLKVGNVDTLNCYYAHGEQNPYFQRRSYWMLDPAYEHIVLVHYREVSEGRYVSASISNLSLDSFSAFSQSTSFSKAPLQGFTSATSELQELHQNSSSSESVEEVSSRFAMEKFESEHSNAMNSSRQPEVGQALRKLAEQLSLDDDNDFLEENLSPYCSQNEKSQNLGLSGYETRSSSQESHESLLQGSEYSMHSQVAEAGKQDSYSSMRLINFSVAYKGRVSLTPHGSELNHPDDAMDALLSFVSTLISGLWVKLGPSSPVQEDVLRIEKALLDIQPALGEAEVKGMHEEPVRRWLMEVKEAASVARNLLIDLELRLLKLSQSEFLSMAKSDQDLIRYQKMIRKEVNEFQVKERESKQMTSEKNRAIATLRRGQGDSADWIREARERIEGIAQMGHKLGLGLGYQTSYDVDRPPVVYGRDDDRKKLIALLLSDYCGGQNVSVVWIAAAGGMGKTTLCHLVYNDPEVRNIFDIRVWVSCIYEIFDVFELLRTIIESLTGITCCLTEICELQETLKEELIDKRFLLVLDNVWLVDQIVWNNLLLPPMRAGAEGSVVIVTSRNSRVPNIMELMPPYYLGSLSKESCWLMFQDLAFDGRVNDQHHEPIEVTKNIILSKCKGVPLVVKALGCLTQHTAAENWFTIISKCGMWDEKKWKNDNLSILRLCYEDLPMYLKRCFVCCSLFPKGYIFEKDHLVRLWMSQSFIPPEDGKRAEDIGAQYFNQLLSRSFFQYSPIYDTKEGKFVMHDLLHDLASYISLPGVKCLRTEDYRLCSIAEDIHHTSFVPRKLETMIPSEPFKESKDLLTFLLINRSILKWDANLFRFEDPAILDDLFLNFTSLRTLDLSNTNIIELPSSVENLKHLCYLGLNNTNIKRLPDSICSFHNLQTMELQHCNCLIELPEDTKNLVNLRHLDVWKEAGFVFMPPEIGQLTSLQTLSTFFVRGDELQCGVRELKDLVSLRGDLCIGGLESVISGKDAKDANLNNKEYLRTLTLQWLDNGWDIDDNERAATAGDVLQSLQPHNNLQELIIRAYIGHHFPSWMGDSSFSKLLSITLDNCYGCNVLPPLGQLPSLRCISIRKMDGVRFVGREFRGSDAAVKTGFPSLETLKLWEMYEWEEWHWVDDGDFPCLRNLTISRCPKLRRLPCFTSLLELFIHCCTDLPGIPTLPSLESLKIEGFQNLESLTLPSDLPALKMLEINYCKQITSVVGLGHLSSVEQLKIIKCPKLQFLPDEQLPLMLQVLHIHCSCPLLGEWCPNGFKEKAGTQVFRKLVRNIQ